MIETDGAAFCLLACLCWWSCLLPFGCFCLCFQEMAIWDSSHRAGRTIMEACHVTEDTVSQDEDLDQERQQITT